MNASVWSASLERKPIADTALRAAARFWFTVVFVGQAIFAISVAAFYGVSAARGDFYAWNHFITHGHVRGDSSGNFAVAMHVLSATVVSLAGALQLIPQLRSRAPRYHRWNGRVYILTAFTAALAGLYITWVNGTRGDLGQHIGGSLSGLAILWFGVMALRTAMARDFRAHRRWALRLFMVVSASWFYRVTFTVWVMINHGAAGFDMRTFTGPFPTVMAYAQFLVPLALLELYLRAQDQGGARRRLVTASWLAVVSLAIAVGSLGVSASAWVPNTLSAFSSRTSIGDTLFATIESRGADAAVQQYHELKAAPAAGYNFDEDELNNLGYELINAGRVADAVRMFRLNVEAYPKSANVYDSLAEAYMDAGDKTQATAYYHKSLELNPQNRNAVQMLRQLETPVPETAEIARCSHCAE